MVVDLSAVRDRLSKILEECPPDAMPDLLGELARAQAVLMSRLTAPGENGARPPFPTVERFLTAEELADKLSLDRKWCYAHATELGAVRLSNGCVRFPEKAILRFLATRKA